jgi:hypothetical protein
MLSAAIAAVLDAASRNAHRLAERVAEKAVRDEIFHQLPKSGDIASGIPVTISVDVAAIVDAEKARIRAAIDSGNVELIISRYPVRETRALTDVAHAIGFQGRLQYESAVLKMMLDDAAVLAEVRQFFGALVADLGVA